MYEQFFQLKEKPFNMTPDPEYLFLTEKHREALAHLVYGVQQRRGFIVVTGEVGTGKTTLCRALLTQFGEDVRLALILNPLLSEIELLKTILNEFYIQITGQSKKEHLDQLDHFLIQQHSQGRNVVLVIDEAQNLPDETLEQIRMISNLETEKAKLIQIILLGQPELGDKLATPALRQLEQRVSVRYHLSPLTEPETASYISHRIRIAGGESRIQFDQRAVRKVHEYARGVPRRVNVLCDRALLVGFVKGTGQITEEMINQAWKELSSEKRKAKTPPVAPSIPEYERRSDSAGFPKTLLIFLIVLSFGVLGVNLWVGLSVKSLVEMQTKIPPLVATSSDTPTLVPFSPTPSFTPIPAAVPQDVSSPFAEPVVRVMDISAPVIQAETVERVPVLETNTPMPLDTSTPVATPTATFSPQPTNTPTAAPPTATPPATKTPTDVPPTATATRSPQPELPTATAVASQIQEASSMFAETFDSDGVLRTIFPDGAASAAWATLCAQLKIPQEEILPQYQKARQDRSEASLTALAAKAGFCEESLPYDMAKVRAINLPFILWREGRQPLVIISWTNDKIQVAPRPANGVEPPDPGPKEWTGQVSYLIPVAWKLEEKMKKGDTSMAIFRMQKSLQALGYITTEPKGYFDAKTEKAVQEFQKSRGLTPDGVVGVDTMLALKSAAEKGSPPRLDKGGSTGAKP